MVYTLPPFGQTVKDLLLQFIFYAFTLAFVTKPFELDHSILSAKSSSVKCNSKLSGSIFGNFAHKFLLAQSREHPVLNTELATRNTGSSFQERKVNCCEFQTRKVDARSAFFEREGWKTKHPHSAW